MKQLQGSGVLFAGVAVVMMAAQPVGAIAAKVTAVQINQTNSGLNVVLQTSSDGRAQVITSKQGNTLIADIINAQLSLPQGNFRQDKPAPGIDSVVVTQLDRNSVRMVVTGSASAPSGQLQARNAQGITLSISPGTGTPAASAPANNRVAATPFRPSQTRTAQRPNVLVPNPKVTIEEAPNTPSRTAQSSPTAPTLPRAVAPPVGDIAVSNTDASPTLIDLGTRERVPRLVLRDAPVREVLSLLARAAGLNLAYTTATPPGSGQQQNQQNAAGAAGGEGPRISLDIQDESVQDVFNSVLRVSGLQAYREERTIFVGPKLPNEARNVITRSMRLNQVTVGVALNFLVALGAESAVSRERTITSVQAVPVGGGTAPATQTQTSTETRIETQRIDFQDSSPLLRGLEVIGDERTNSVTLVGSSKQIDIATSQLIQLDSRRRQVAVNVKIVDINLTADENFSTSFSFGLGNNFFSNDAGAASFNFGGINPPTSTTARGTLPRVTTNTYGSGQQPFLDAQPNAPYGTGTPQQFANPSLQTGNIQQGSGAYPRPPFGTEQNPLQPGVTAIPTTGPITFSLPTLFQYPKRFLSLLQAQVTSGNAKILTDPTLIVQEGQQANVNLTQEVVGNIRNDISDTTAGTRQTVTIEKQNVGLTLGVKIDRIDDNGFVSLSVAPVVKAAQAPVTTPNGQIVLVSERSLNSGSIRLRDNQTLILSGIIQDTDRAAVTKIPILGDLPIIGALFRSTNKQNERSEVVVLLTPQIIDDSERSSSMGYNYTPSTDVRQMLERSRGGVNPPANRR